MIALPSAIRAYQFVPITLGWLFLAGNPRRADAQTLGGQIVQLDTKKPLGGASVALVNDSARVVASTAASSEGSFYLDAPNPGLYRVVFFVAGASFVSPTVQLDSGKTVERLFSVPDVPATFTATPFARDVTTPASILPISPTPGYPGSLAEKGTRGLVSTMFVVTEKGQPDMSTFRVLNSADADFVLAVRDALHRSRFIPADKDGKSVPQVVQLTYDFGLADDPVRGDVIIRVAAPAAPTAAKTQAKQRYIVNADELSQADIVQLTLPDALNRLRPAVFTQSVISGGVDPSDAPVFVNDVRVDGMNALRSTPVSRVQEVRFWRREEAAVRFGMHYLYAITVKLKPQ
jgi:hypothetical protein